MFLWGFTDSGLQLPGHRREHPDCCGQVGVHELGNVKDATATWGHRRSEC